MTWASAAAYGGNNSHKSSHDINININCICPTDAATFWVENVAMAPEYMSTSKTTICDVAAKLVSNEVEEEPKVFRY